MRRAIRVLAIVAAMPMGTGSTGSPQASAAEKPTWVDLFKDGKALKGWKEVGGGKWSVENGELVGKTGDGRYGWLVTEKVYADFELELECRHEAGGNSGIQFRSHVIDGVMHGWQAEFDPRLSEPNGGVYDEGGKRGWVKEGPRGKDSPMKPMEWNRYRIACVGDHVTIEVNGERTADFHDRQFTRGIIALQVHSGKEPPVHVRWRNIRIRERDELEGYKPLFDGKTLKGWHVAGAEKWVVEDGQIVAQCKQNAAYCYLVSDAEYADIDVKLKYLYESQTGNSGFFFRCGIEGVDIKGPQSEISPHRGEHTGCVYDSRGRGWLNLKQWDAFKDAKYDPKAWNTMEVRVVGKHIWTWVNGYPVTDFVDEPIPPKGILALQMHSGEAMRIRFKDIYLKVPKAATTGEAK